MERSVGRPLTTVAIPLACILVALSGCSLFSPSRSANREIEQTVDKLIQSLAESDDHATAIGGLVALGPQAPAALAKGLDHPDEHLRAGVLEAVTQMPTDPAVPLLLTVLDDDDWKLRLAAVEALGSFRDRRAVAPLMKRYEVDDDDQVRYECLTSLGLIGDPAAVDLLVKGTSDSDPYVRMWAMDALCEMKDPHAEALTLALLDDPNENVRFQVLVSCASSMDTPDGNAKLVELALTADRFEVSALARRYLRQRLQNPATGPQLREQIRQAGVEALQGKLALRGALLLGDISDPRAKDQLIVALHDPNPFVRHHAAYLLGQLGDPSVVPSLIETLQDHEPIVAATAFESLRVFGEHGDERAQAAVAGYKGERLQLQTPR